MGDGDGAHPFTMGPVTAVISSVKWRLPMASSILPPVTTSDHRAMGVKAVHRSGSQVPIRQVRYVDDSAAVLKRLM